MTASNEPMIQLEAKDGHDAPWAPVGKPKPAPVSNTPELDRAIEAACVASFDADDTCDGFEPSDKDRTYARALVAELIKDVRPTLDMNPRAWPGFNRAIYEIKRRAGLEGEG